MHNREPNEVAEVDGEPELGNGQERFEGSIFAGAPRLRTVLDSILRCARKFRTMIEDRFQNGSRIIERKPDPEREQAGQEEYLSHPDSRVEDSLRANVTNGHGT